MTQGVPPDVEAKIPFRLSGLYDASVTIGIKDDDKYTEAELSAAAQTRVGQLFEIEAVTSFQPGEVDEVVDFGDQWLTIVDVDTRDGLLDYSDVRLFHSKVGGMRMASQTDIQPSISRPQQAGSVGGSDDGVVPKMVTRVESNRGLHDEFVSGLENMVSPWAMGDAIIEVDTSGAGNVGYIVGRGGTMQDWSELDRDSFGPGGKSVTDISFGGIAVENEVYQQFLSEYAADGGGGHGGI